MRGGGSLLQVTPLYSIDSDQVFTGCSWGRGGGDEPLRPQTTDVPLQLSLHFPQQGQHGDVKCRVGRGVEQDAARWPAGGAPGEGCTSIF